MHGNLELQRIRALLFPCKPNMLVDGFQQLLDTLILRLVELLDLASSNGIFGFRGTAITPLSRGVCSDRVDLVNTLQSVS